jgi:steroid delta-isomerase-like uncharacterized protein
MSTTDNAALVRRYFAEAFTPGNLDVLDQLVSPDLRLTNIRMGRVMEGRQVLRDIVTRDHAMFPDIQAHVERVIAEGDQVFAWTTMRGTHSGEPFMGTPPSGKPFAMTEMYVIRIENGQIAEMATLEDPLSLFTQLGIQLPPTA